MNKLYDMVKEKSLAFDRTQHVEDNQTWNYHINPVIQTATKFAKMRGGDVEVVEMAALFHDYANLVDIKKYSDTHHIVSGEMAEPFLRKAGYDDVFISKVKKVIYSHRASVVKDKFTVEEQCLADADAITHIENVIELIMWRACIGETVKQTSAFVKGKIQRSFAKLSDFGKDYIRERYEATMKIFYQIFFTFWPSGVSSIS